MYSAADQKYAEAAKQLEQQFATDGGNPPQMGVDPNPPKESGGKEPSQWKNRLSFTPASLLVRIGRRFDIPRERVVAIKPKMFTSTGTGQTTRHWDLVYVPAGGGSNRIMAMLDSSSVSNRRILLPPCKHGRTPTPTTPA